MQKNLILETNRKKCLSLQKKLILMEDQRRLERSKKKVLFKKTYFTEN